MNKKGKKGGKRGKRGGGRKKGKKHFFSVVLPELGSMVSGENSTSAKEMAEWSGVWKRSLGLSFVQQRAS